MRKSVILTLVVFFAFAAHGQLKLPRPSPAASVSQEAGIGKVTVTYHRPSVKGRKIFGELVPFGQIWRLGANEATTLEISHPAKVAGKDLAAGRYALFAIPGEGEWTFVVNSTAEQWGTYNRDEAKDVLKFTAKPAVAEMTESFTIALRPESDTIVVVEPAWDKVRVPFTVEFDTNALVWKEIETQLAAKPDDATILLQSARYAMQKGERLDDAMKWVDRSIAAKEGYSNQEVKAKILQKQGKTAEAIKHLDRALALAEGKTPADYTDGLKKTRAEWAK